MIFLIMSQLIEALKGIQLAQCMLKRNLKSEILIIFFKVGGDKTIALYIVLKNENIGKIQMQMENAF